MVPSTRSALLEIFPPGTFVRDAQVSMKSLGINYIAFWNDQCVYLSDCVSTKLTFSRIHSGESLPPVILPTESTSVEVLVNVPSLIGTIRKV